MSSSTSTIDRGHPITVAAAEMKAVLDQVAEQSTWSMTDHETRTTLCQLTRLAAQVAELELRVAAHAETNKVGDQTGATSAAAWWAHATRQTRGAAHRKVRLAKALDTDEYTPVREALAAGRVLADQAGVIVAAVEALPDDAEDWVKPKSQQWLLDQARDHDARALRILGKRIYAVIDPEAADAHEAEQLRRKGRRRRPRPGSGCTTTATAKPMASSRSPPSRQRSCARPCRRSCPPATSPRLGKTHSSTPRPRTGPGSRSWT